MNELENFISCMIKSDCRQQTNFTNKERQAVHQFVQIHSYHEVTLQNGV
jgi:hypothetical protein